MNDRDFEALVARAYQTASTRPILADPTLAVLARLERADRRHSLAVAGAGLIGAGLTAGAFVVSGAGAALAQTVGDLGRVGLASGPDDPRLWALVAASLALTVLGGLSTLLRDF